MQTNPCMSHENQLEEWREASTSPWQHGESTLEANLPVEWLKFAAIYFLVHLEIVQQWLLLKVRQEQNIK